MLHYFFIDTCIWLSLAKSRNKEALITALEDLISHNDVTIVTSTLVIEEFNRNKEKIIKSSQQRLSQELKQLKGIISEYGRDKKEEAISELNDIDTRLPLLSEVTDLMANRLLKIMNNGILIHESDTPKMKAIERALSKKAPFHRSKNSVADAILIETFAQFVNENRSESNQFSFLTENYTDFSAIDRRKPHEDFSTIFTGKVYYSLSLEKSIREIDDDLLVEYEHELSWIDEEVRGLSDILDSIEEFTDKIWYNRHMNLIYEIENDKVTIVPQGTKKYGNDVIHEDILKRAKNSAEKVRAKYKDLGPWSDFEWGMLNGKLSALRWVLGDEWDMLDT
jgi:hypothetical protein